MNLIIPFTKDIKFNTNISEILSISLEHDYTINDGELLGNFTVSGEYKTHEVSVNREKFENVLPFSVEISNRIDAESLDFEIQDFTYELVDHNTLRVNIEYSVNAVEEKEKREDFETILDNAISEIEDVELPLEETREDEVVEEPTIEEEIVEPETRNNDEKEEKNDVSDNDKEIVMDSVKSADETFVTYHIHIMKETDTIETVCAKYNTNESILSDYNDLSTLTIGEKLVIPDLNE